VDPGGTDMFDQFVVARAAALRRTAYLLTGAFIEPWDLVEEASPQQVRSQPGKQAR